jgi:hypothetical protein
LKFISNTEELTRGRGRKNIMIYIVYLILAKSLNDKRLKWPEHVACVRSMKFTHNLAGQFMHEVTGKVKEDCIKLLQFNILLLSEKLI